MTRGVAAALAATAVCGLAATVPSTVHAAADLRIVSPARVNRVADTVLPGERFTYRRENWHIRDADGLPTWLSLRHGRLVGTAPGLGRWRIELGEAGVAKQRGETRRTVLVLSAVPERAAPGTVLVTRGLDGRPADAESSDVVVSGDGGTVFFASRATNLVPSTEESVGRLYAWDSSTRQVSLLHPEHWARLEGVSRDGQHVLVALSAGTFLLDRTDGSQAQVAPPRTADAALTADGERVFFQDPPGTVPPRLLEWTRATGATRTVVADLGPRHLVGVSADGRLALLSGSSGELLDTTTGAVRDVGRLGIEGGYAGRATVADDGRLLAVHGTGPAAGHGVGGDRIDVVHDTVLGAPLGPGTRNPGAAITADGTHYVVASATRHLRVVEVATGTRTSPFVAAPSGHETWASLSDDATDVAYVSDAHDLLRGTRRGVANVYVWVRSG